MRNMPFTEKDFKAMEAYRDRQMQPHEKDIRLCIGCGNDCRSRATTHSGDDDLSVRASVSIDHQDVLGDDGVGVVAREITIDWTQYSANGPAGGGVYDVERPRIGERRGKMGEWLGSWHSMDVSQILVNRIVEIATLEAEVCAGPTPEGLCPVALAVAEDVCQRVIERPL